MHFHKLSQGKQKEGQLPKRARSNQTIGARLKELKRTKTKKTKEHTNKPHHKIRTCHYFGVKGHEGCECEA